MNWKKMIVIGALACGAAGLVAGCGGEKKAAARRRQISKADKNCGRDG